MLAEKVVQAEADLARLATDAELGELLRCSRFKAKGLARQIPGAVVRVGRLIRFRPAVVLRHLAAVAEGGAA